MLKHLALLLFAVLASPTNAAENSLGSVYLPLAGEQDGIRIERVPAVLGHASPEQEIDALAQPFRAIQTTTAPIPDSNLVTLYGLKISCEQLPEARYRIDLDVRAMKRPQQYEHAEDEVVEATLICLRLMFPAGSGRRISIRIISEPEQRERWQSLERAFFPSRP
jgi:hypothetical protein